MEMWIGGCVVKLLYRADGLEELNRLEEIWDAVNGTEGIRRDLWCV